MDTKSHVSMEQKVCSVCGTVYDSGAILLHKRLSQVLDRHTVTGYGLCKDCEKLKLEGYIALVEVTNTACDNLKQENANRTGLIAHIRSSIWADIFNQEIDPEQFMAFVEKGVIQKLQEMSNG